MKTKYTRKDLEKDYPTEDSCLEAIYQNRYGNDFACPNCNKSGKFHKIAGRKRYDCQCGHSLNPLSGTIFHKSDTPLKDWFFAMFLFSCSKNGVSAKELERELGVTYKTAWRMAKQIRLLFSQNGLSLSGTIEMDETYYGGKKRGGKRGLGSENKTPVFGMVEREGKIQAHVTKIRTKKVMPIISRTVVTGSTIMTDQLMMYRNLPKLGFEHEHVNHSVKEYVRGRVHTNTIEGFWSQLKRSIDGTYHSVSKKYLQKYVDEFCYRYNHRETAIFPLLVLAVSKPV